MQTVREIFQIEMQEQEHALNMQVKADAGAAEIVLNNENRIFRQTKLGD